MGNREIGLSPKRTHVFLMCVCNIFSCIIATTTPVCDATLIYMVSKEQQTTSIND